MKLKQIKVTKKQILTSAVLVAVFLLGSGINSLFTNKFAIVDVQKVVRSSEMVQLLRSENDAEIKDLSKWLDSAKFEIDLEKKKAKKEALAHEYQKIAKEREEKIKQAYQTKLKKINDNITKVVTDVAHSYGCKTILDKAIVIQGGIDITGEVIQKINVKK